MSLEQEGAYIRLLCYCWNDEDCSLPSDDEVLSRLSRMGEGWLKGGSTEILKCFQPHPTKSNFLTNKRLLAEREKQNKWREKSVDGGKKSGKSRRNKVLKGGSKMVEPNGNSSSSTSTSSSTSKDITNPEGLVVKPENGLPECPHQEIISIFHETCPENPRVVTWTNARKAHLRARWREISEVKLWRQFFEIVAASDFLTGKASSSGRKPFFATLPWLIKPENFAKVLEGNYQ